MKINRNAGHVFSLAVVLFASLLTVWESRPASADTQQAISQKVKKFYGWYVGELNKDKRPSENRAMIRNYSSRRLWKWFHSKAFDEFDADYFLAAQDFAPNWGTNLAISNFNLKGNVATFSMKMGRAKSGQNPMGPHTIKLKLVKENSVWKIDRVNGN